MLKVGKLNYIFNIDSCLFVFWICHICYYIVCQGNEALSPIAILDDLQNFSIQISFMWNNVVSRTSTKEAYNILSDKIYRENS